MLAQNSLFAMTKVEFTESPIFFVHDYEDGTPMANLVDYLNQNFRVSDLEGFDLVDLDEYGSAEMLIPSLEIYLKDLELFEKFDFEEDQELIPLHIMELKGKRFIISVATIDVDEDAEDEDSEETWD